jgi:preprotein translocase subunit SecA
MARQNRFRRRILMDSLAEVLFDDNFSDRRTRFHAPTRPGDAFFVYQIFRRGKQEYDEYRRQRFQLLYATALVTKLAHPDALDIVVIGMEAATDVSHTEDAVFYDARTWSPEDERVAVKLQADLDMLVKPIRRELSVENEYPRLPIHRVIVPKSVRVGRNEPCPCGSGAKFKRCHGG